MRSTNQQLQIELVSSSRRGFLMEMFSAGALILGGQFVIGEDKAYGATPVASDATKAAFSPNIFLGIEPDGTVIIVAHRSEMGTGSRTSLPMVVADELEADWKRVRIQQAIGDKRYGDQNTDGSCSIRDFYKGMRQVGAGARLMLERAAASKWGVDATECKARNHQVVHAKSGKTLGFGELASLAAQQPVPSKEDLKLKPSSEFRYIGKENVPIADLADLCTGRGVFGMDTNMPGMLYASIERSPVYGGKLKSFDDSAAKAVKGVQDTIVIDAFKPPHLFQPLGGVAVLADNTWSAMQGRKKLKVEWDLGEHVSFDSPAFRKELLASAQKPGKVARNVGDVDAEFAKSGAKIIEASYYTPHLAHAAMEPPAALAVFKDGKFEIWTATQNPQAVQDTVAGVCGVQPSDVTCHVTLLGGGFGRKSKPDYVAEAALLAKKTGKPVKVVWSREEDIKFDYYHAAAGMYMKAAVDAEGKPAAWLQRSAFPSIGSTFIPGADHAMDIEMGMGWTELPFQIPNHRAENCAGKNHVRIGWLRAVANIYHAFAMQSFVDELAAAANRDRVEYMLELIGPARNLELDKPWNNGKPVTEFPYDMGRFRNVIQLAADKSGWGKRKLPKGHALGIAAHRSFLTYVATVAEVSVDAQGKARVERVDIAADAGQIINPDRARAQFEGAVVFGTSIAMMGEITASGGAVQQSNFHNYPVARMNDAPREINVHIVPSNELPAGVGEPGVPPVAPAICNAYFAATGKRVRELPLKRHGFA
jgi:isoquinoline 1-oxidoreductase subunit beta